jgi:hypothetical protein
MVLVLSAACGTISKAGSTATDASTGSNGKTGADASAKVSQECIDEPTKCADQSALAALSPQTSGATGAKPAVALSGCDSVTGHSGWKHICIAITTKSLAECDKFTDPDDEHFVPQEMQARCEWWVIAAMGKPSMCDNPKHVFPTESKEQTIGDCYRTLALTTKNKALCAKSNDPAYCEKEYAEFNNEITLKDCNGDDTCLLNYAFFNKDKAACDEVSDMFKLACQVQLSGDSQACRQLHDVDYWYFCDLRSHFKEMMPAKDTYNFGPCGTIHQCYKTIMPLMVRSVAT